MNYLSSWNQFFSSHRVYLHLRICCLGPKPNPSGQDHVQHSLYHAWGRDGARLSLDISPLQALLQGWTAEPAEDIQILTQKITCRSPRSRHLGLLKETCLCHDCLHCVGVECPKTISLLVNSLGRPKAEEMDALERMVMAQNPPLTAATMQTAPFSYIHILINSSSNITSPHQICKF